MMPDSPVVDPATMPRSREALKAEWEALSGWQKPLVAADDLATLAANGATFGFGPKIAASIRSKVAGTDYDTDLAAMRAKIDEARTRAGGAGMASEIGGSVLPASKLMQAGVSATRIPGAVGAYLGPALDGAGYGALQAMGNDQDVATGAATGAAFGTAGQLVGKGVGKAIDAWKGRGKIPSLPDLEDAKNAAYRAVDNAGETFAPEQVKTLAQGIGDDLNASGIDPVLNPMPYRFQQVIQSKAAAPLTLRELDKIDSKIGRKLLTSTDGEDRYLGGVMRDNISEFMDANGGSGTVAAAREANKKFRNLERVLQQTERAQRRASSTGSGGNEDNAIRQNIRQILDNPRTSKFYGPEDRAAMEKVVAGTAGQNLARRIGKLSPENGGLMANLSVIGSYLNPAMAIPAAAGFVSKRIADRATRSNLDELIHRLSTGQDKPKMTPAQKKTIDAFMRTLSMGGTTAALSSQR